MSFLARCKSIGEIIAGDYEKYYSVNKCMIVLRTKIERNWQKPVETEGMETTVFIEIGDKGEVSTFDFTISSGNANFDDSVKKAIYNASPFSEFAGLSEKSLK